MPRAARKSKAPKIGFVSLGCPKALVDSERILTQLKLEGYDIVSSYEGADVVVVNTCGFVDDAVHESLDTIGEALRDDRLGGAVCDVYSEQPLRRDHPFLGLDNMVLTAHVGGLTQESMRRLSIGSAQEVVRLLRDEKPVNFVNPEVWDKHLERVRQFK